MQALGRNAPSRSAQRSLDGLDDDVGKVEARVELDVSEEMAATGLGRATIGMLVDTYGRGYGRILDVARKYPDGLERLCPDNPEIVGQLHHAVREEMAVTLQDVLLRRTGIGQSACLGRDCAEPIARRMAEICGWSRRRLDAELHAYRGHVERSLRFREPAPGVRTRGEPGRESHALVVCWARRDSCSMGEGPGRRARTLRPRGGPRSGLGGMVWPPSRSDRPPDRPARSGAARPMEPLPAAHTRWPGGHGQAAHRTPDDLDHPRPSRSGKGGAGAWTNRRRTISSGGI